MGRGSATTAPAESTWKTKCSMNEFAQLDLLMNLYVMDYYHAPPSYHPMERNANQRRTRKAADVERAVAREPASQPSPPSAGDAKASRDVGKLQNGKRVGLTCALTGGC